MTKSNEPNSHKVWDPVVRIGHWIIVIGVAAAYLSGDEAQTIHLIAGYTVAAVILFRIVWGFIGTRHARFSDFVRGPFAIAGYLKGLVSGKSKRHLGHNPAGGAMVIALILSLLVTTFSGMALLAVEENKGPLAPFFATEAVSSAPAPSEKMVRLERQGYEDHDDDDDEDEYGEKGENGAEDMLESVHKIFTYLTLGLAALHILGVILSGRVHGENLVWAMVTGKKANKP